MFLTIPAGLDQMRVRGIPHLSLGVAILCIVGYLAGLGIGDEVYALYGMIPANGWVQLGSLTSLFLHVGLTHLLGNFLFLYLAAPVVEDAWGRWAFALLYLGGGLVADVAQVALDPSSSVPVVGASGAIAACMGALCLQFPRRKVRMFYWIFPRYSGMFFVPVWLWGGFWFVREVVRLATDTGGGVAFGAHVGGFLFGVAMAVVMRRFREPSAPPEPVSAALPRRSTTPIAKPELPQPELPQIPASTPAVTLPPPRPTPTPPTAPLDAPQPEQPAPTPRPFPKAPGLRQ